MSKQVPDQAKLSKKRSLIVIISILIIIAAAFLVPLLIPNGVGDYTGAMKSAAEAQLKNAPSLKDNLKKATSLPTLEYHVEKVFETPAETAKFWCGGSFDPAKTYYSVTISEFTLFGIKTDEFTRHDACILR
jgi:hypothetical protein